VRRAGLRVPVERFAAGFAVPARAVPAPADLARVPADFFALLRFAVEAVPVERLAVERLAAVLRPPLFLAAVPLRADEDEPALVPALASIDHLLDMTR